MLASWLFQLTGSNFEPLNLHLFDFTGGLFSTRMPAFKRDPKDPKRANPARYPQHHVIIESHNIISLSFRFKSKHESRHQNFKPFPTITSCFFHLKKKTSLQRPQKTTSGDHLRWPQGKNQGTSTCFSSVPRPELATAWGAARSWVDSVGLSWRLKPELVSWWLNQPIWKIWSSNWPVLQCRYYENRATSYSGQIYDQTVQ